MTVIVDGQPFADADPDRVGRVLRRAEALEERFACSTPASCSNGVCARLRTTTWDQIVAHLAAGRVPDVTPGRALHRSLLAPRRAPADLSREVNVRSQHPVVVVRRIGPHELALTLRPPEDDDPIQLTWNEHGFLVRDGG